MIFLAPDKSQHGNEMKALLKLKICLAPVKSDRGWFFPWLSQHLLKINPS